MNNNYSYTCPSIYSPLIGKVIKFDKSKNWYLLQMPKKKNDKELDFRYCNINLEDYINKWVEIKIKEYTMYGRKEEINILTKTELKKRNIK
jgi:hypothetical protein